MALEGLSNALGPRLRPSKRCYRATAECLLPDNAPLTEKSPVTPVAASLAHFLARISHSRGNALGPIRDE